MLKYWPMGLVLAALSSPAEAATDDFQTWPTVVVTGKLSKDLLGFGEIVTRVVDDSNRLGQVEGRLLIGHPLSKSVTIWAGYVRTITYATAGRNGIENQIAEQLNWTIAKPFGGSLSSRTRLEERFQRGVSETSWRVRQQVKLSVPFRKGGPSAVVSVEPFFVLNRTSGGEDGFDQVRSFVGVSVPVAKHIDIEVGYLNQYLNRRPVDRSNHAIPVTLTYKF